MCYKLIVEYNPRHSEGLTDMQCHMRLASIKAALEHDGPSPIHITTGNELLVSLTRLLIIDGTLRSTELVYKYGDHIIPIDNNARIHFWPPGFCDNNAWVLEQLFAINDKIVPYEGLP